MSNAAVSGRGGRGFGGRVTYGRAANRGFLGWRGDGYGDRLIDVAPVLAPGAAGFVVQELDLDGDTLRATICVDGAAATTDRSISRRSLARSRSAPRNGTRTSTRPPRRCRRRRSRRSSPPAPRSVTRSRNSTAKRSCRGGSVRPRAQGLERGKGRRERHREHRRRHAVGAQGSDHDRGDDGGGRGRDGDPRRGPGARADGRRPDQEPDQRGDRLGLGEAGRAASGCASDRRGAVESAGRAGARARAHRGRQDDRRLPRRPNRASGCAGKSASPSAGDRARRVRGAGRSRRAAGDGAGEPVGAERRRVRHGSERRRRRCDRLERRAAARRTCSRWRDEASPARIASATSSRVAARPRRSASSSPPTTPTTGTGSWLGMPHAIEYVAYFDKSDPTFPAPLNESAGTAAKGAAAHTVSGGWILLPVLAIGIARHRRRALRPGGIRQGQAVVGRAQRRPRA